MKPARRPTYWTNPANQDAWMRQTGFSKAVHCEREKKRPKVTGEFSKPDKYGVRRRLTVEGKGE